MDSITSFLAYCYRKTNSGQLSINHYIVYRNRQLDRAILGQFRQEQKGMAFLQVTLTHEGGNQPIYPKSFCLRKG